MFNFDGQLENIRAYKTAPERLQAFLEGVRHEVESVLNSDPEVTRIGFDRLFTIDEQETGKLMAALEAPSENGHAKSAHVPVKHGRQKGSHARR